MVIRPDACKPPTRFAPDVADFAKYAEVNAIVLLHPCVGGVVNRSKCATHGVESDEVSSDAQLEWCIAGVCIDQIWSGIDLVHSWSLH